MNIEHYYKNVFTKDFFKQDYENYKLKVEEYKNYLKKELLLNPKNVKVSCQLASAYLETRENPKDAIEIMENILKKYENEISENEKCELYTNLAFFYLEESSIPYKGYEYLIKAVSSGSPYPETYNALGIYYSDEYYSEGKTDNKKAQSLFKKAFELDICDKYNYNYAVSLYENGSKDEAECIFENIINRKNELYYPSLYAYALIMGLKGDIKKCLDIACKLLENIDECGNFNPEIAEDNIADLYYLCGEYKKHNDIYDNAKIGYCRNADFLSTYFYALYALKENDKLKSFYDEVMGEKLNLIKDKEKDKEDSEEEKNEYITDIKKDMDEIDDVYKKIINENYRPKPNTILSLTYGCYLIDCIRHGRY